MKILQLTAYYPPDIGGIQIFVQNLSRALVNRGHDVDVLTVNTDFASSFETTCEGINVRRCQLDSHLYRAVISREFSRRLFQARAYDVYHIHIPFHFGLETAVMAAKRNGTTLIATHHGQGLDGSFIYSAIARTYSWLCQAVSLRFVDCPVFLTESYKRSLWLPDAVQRRTKIVRTGTEIRSFGIEVDGSPIREKYQIGADDPMILLVARLHRANRYKGVPYLLQAMTNVLQHINNAKLLVVGDGELLPELKQQAMELHLAHAVTFTGAIDNSELPAYYAATDVLALPSISGPENAPVVVFEAMAAGKPVVASNLPGVCEIVEHERSGLLVPPKNVEALADALVQMLSDSAFRSRAGEHGRSLVRNYTWDTCAMNMETIYGESGQK